MATAAVLDIAKLVAPIAGDNPAGQAVPLTLWTTLNDERKEFQPNPDDRLGDPIVRKVNWEGLSNLLQKTLVETSKDIRLAVRLTEALVKRHGYAGLRDSFRMLRELVQECWERMYPQEEDRNEQAELRAGAFHWLNTSDSGALFPNTIRSVPVLKLGSQRYSVNDFLNSMQGQGPVAKADLGRLALSDAAVGRDFEESVTAFAALQQTLSERLEGAAPGLTEVARALEESQSVLGQFLVAELLPPPVVTNGDVEQPRPSSEVNIASRQEAYQQVERMADLLERLEPHSPIPYLLRRAVLLGKMPFDRLIRELVRNDDYLAEIRREFGIKEEGS